MSPAQAWCRSAGILPSLILILILAPTTAAAAPPVPSQPTATCDAYSGGKCYVNGAFTLSSFSSGADHYKVCRSGDTTGWGGCEVVMSNNTGSSYTVSGANLPSNGYRRAYFFSACDATNDCTRWADNSQTYIYMDLTGPSAPGATNTSCLFQSSGCWVQGNFTVSVSPAFDSGSGVGSYDICRSNDSTGGQAGCNVFMTTAGGTSFTVSGSNLPSDGFRRAYYFRGNDQVGNNGTWNIPIYVRVDRYSPTVSANNASSTWLTSRTVTISAADATNGTASNSGLADVRYRWNAAHNGACTSGTATGNGAVLTVPEGDNHLYLCARDNTGRVGFWNGGPYRVDTTAPSLGSLTISSSTWNIDDGSTYSITSSATDSRSGVREIRNRINVQGSNTANERGVFSWNSSGYVWAADQLPCTGGGFASKNPTVANPGTITLVGCSTSLSGSTRTVTFSVRPNETFGEFGPINDISSKAGDTVGNWTGWLNHDLNFESVTHPPTVSANSASSAWFTSRTTTVSASAHPGSTLQSVRYRWGSAHNASCTSGTATSNGASLTVPEGDNHLYLCATDSLGRVGTWDGGPYRVDETVPSLGALTTSSNVWLIDDGSTYGITATVTDDLSGVKEIRTRTNIQGSNAGNERGLFSWHQYNYAFVSDQMPCAGGGFASKYNGAHTNPDAVTLVGCSTSLAGSTRTVTFTVLPNESFGEFGPIHDISLRSGDIAGNWNPWTLYDLNFSSQLSLQPDFSLSIDPSSRNVPRQGLRTFTVTVGGVDGFSNAVSLSVSGLPAGVTGTFSPASVSPGSSSVLTLRADIDAPLAGTTFTVTGTGGGKTHTVQADATVIQNEPVIDSVTPFPVQRGAVRTLTIQGSELMDANVYVATEPYDETTPPRVYPTAQLISASADGTRLTVDVDVSAAGIDGWYSLGVSTPGGAAAGPFRVVGPEPVVDFWTPSEPVEGKLHVLAVAGVNLAGADVVPTDPNVHVLQIDNSNDEALTGLLLVDNGATLDGSELRISGPGGTTDLPMRPLPSAVTAPSPELESVVLKAGDEPGEDGESLALMLQAPRLLTLQDQEEADLRNRAAAIGSVPICGAAGVSRRRSFNHVIFTLLDDELDPLLIAVLEELVPGDFKRFVTQTAVVSGFLQFDFLFRICTDDTFGQTVTDIAVCISGGVSTMIPGLGGKQFTFSACLGDSQEISLAADGGVSSQSWSSSNGCLEVQDLGGWINNEVVIGSPSGRRREEAEMICCEATDLSVNVQGTAFGEPFATSGTVAQLQPRCLHGARYDIEVRAFIPFNNVGPVPGEDCIAPNGEIRGVYFEGDDREYDADPPSFRMQQLVSVYPDQLACTLGKCDASGLIQGSRQDSTGITSSFAENALTNNPLGVIDDNDYDNIAEDCDLWHKSGLADTEGWLVEVTRVHQKRVQVRLKAEGANPITTFPAPDVDWDLTVTLDEDTPISRWEITGSTDCFPGYEVWVTRSKPGAVPVTKQILGFLPPDGSVERVALCLPAPMDNSYDCQGDFDSPTPPECFQ